MDLLFNMLSLAKDLSSTQKQLQKFNIEIKYQLRKAQRLLSLINNEEHDILFMVDYLKLRIKEAEIYSKKFDELLETQKMGIKDKIKLNLPFDQTKKQATSVIENLKKAISDVENQINNSSQNNISIKKKIHDTKVYPVSLSNKEDSEEKQIDEKIQEIYEMGPTIKEDQIIYSQRVKQSSIQFTIQLNAEQKLIESIKDSGVHETKLKMTLQDKFDEKSLYTVARQNFSAVYKKIKQITKEIDGISTKGHFSFIVRKNANSPIKQAVENQGTLSLPGSHKKKQRRSQDSQKHEGKEEDEIFFSFPEENMDFFQSYKMLIKKQDPGKSVYIFKQQQWTKIEEQEYQIMNGDELAAFLNPKTNQPALSFKFSYQLISK